MAITTMLQGGCGNQMFQLAFGLQQARRHNTDLILDTTLLEQDRMRQYNLGLFRGVNEKIVTGSVPNVFEQGLAFNRRIFYDVKDGDVLRGYWQSEAYFSGVEREIREKFQFRQPLPTYNVVHRIREAGKHSVALTIRRSDYLLKQDYHGVLPWSYYEAALAKIEEKHGSLRVFIFSDEPEWCQQNIQMKYPHGVVGTFDRTTHDHLGREDYDLYLMSLCHNVVLANSSFSFWGAWLGDENKPDRVVIGPKQWFTTPTADSSTIMPERWIRI